MLDQSPRWQAHRHIQLAKEELPGHSGLNTRLGLVSGAVASCTRSFCGASRYQTKQSLGAIDANLWSPEKNCGSPDTEGRLPHVQPINVKKTSILDNRVSQELS